MKYYTQSRKKSKSRVYISDFYVNLRTPTHLESIWIYILNQNLELVRSSFFIFCILELLWRHQKSKNSTSENRFLSIIWLIYDSYHIFYISNNYIYKLKKNFMCLLIFFMRRRQIMACSNFFGTLPIDSHSMSHIIWYKYYLISCDEIFLFLYKYWCFLLKMNE